MNSFINKKTMSILFSALLASQVQAQIMISYDGNENKNMVKSIHLLEGVDSETYVFRYNSDRTLAALEYTGIYESDSENVNFNYSWQQGKLCISGDIDGMSFGTIEFPLNASHYVTKDVSMETEFLFTYDDSGYMTSFSEDGIPGTVKWEDGNVKEYIFGDYKRVYTYGDIANTANIDFGICSFADEGFFCLPLGKWSRNMPDNLKEYHEGRLSYDANIEYIIDENNRITKMTVTGTEYEDNGTHSNESTTIEISYDDDFSSAIQMVTDETYMQRAYDLSGREVRNVERGLRIIRSKDGKARKQLFPVR